MQNIYAGFGLLKIESRISICKNDLEAVKVLVAGIVNGLLLAVLLTIAALILFEKNNNFSLLFISGYTLAVVDGLIIYHAYKKNIYKITILKTLRIIGPLVIAKIAALFILSVSQIILAQSLVMMLVLIPLWKILNNGNLWLKVSKQIVEKYKRKLKPSIIYSILNGVFINGITPILYFKISPEIAGQFALLIRILGGGVGVVSNALTIFYAAKDFVKVKIQDVKNILSLNIIMGCAICIAIYMPLEQMSLLFYKKELNISIINYSVTSAFIIITYAIGSVSMLAVRLKDEWWLAQWQVMAIIVWVLITASTQSEYLVFALQISATIMYLILALRWFYLIKNQMMR